MCTSRPTSPARLVFSGVSGRPVSFAYGNNENDPYVDTASPMNVPRSITVTLAAVHRARDKSSLSPRMRYPPPTPNHLAGQNASCASISVNLRSGPTVLSGVRVPVRYAAEATIWRMGATDAMPPNNSPDRASAYVGDRRVEWLACAPMTSNARLRPDVVFPMPDSRIFLSSALIWLAFRSLAPRVSRGGRTKGALLAAVAAAVAAAALVRTLGYTRMES